jgi:hypothetical protein
VRELDLSYNTQLNREFYAVLNKYLSNEDWGLEYLSLEGN